MTPSVAVLFARSDSVYKSIPSCDVYDLERDARSFAGDLPVIAHPPCRGWGRLRKFSNHTLEELDLAHFAIERIRENGGVLEHPAGSKLFGEFLPLPGQRDSAGWTLPIFQSWFGHRAEKATYLYIAGVDPQDIPSFPLSISTPTHVVETRLKGEFRRPSISKAEREQTPPDLAVWLVDLVSAVARYQVFA